MRYIGTRYYRLDTELGTLLLWHNDGTSVSCRTEREHNLRYMKVEGGTDGIVDHVTVGPTDYYVHDHTTIGEYDTLTHYDDGIRRVLGRFDDRPAPTHVAKVRKILDEAYRAYLATDAARDRLRAGAYARANNELDSLTGKIADHRAALDELERQAEACRAIMTENGDES